MTNKQRNKHYLDFQCLSVINSNIYKIFKELFCGNGEQLYFSKFFEWALLVAGGHKALLNDQQYITIVKSDLYQIIREYFFGDGEQLCFLQLFL